MITKNSRIITLLLSIVHSTKNTRTKFMKYTVNFECEWGALSTIEIVNKTINPLSLGLLNSYNGWECSCNSPVQVLMLRPVKRGLGHENWWTKTMTYNFWDTNPHTYNVTHFVCSTDGSSFIYCYVLHWFTS